MITSTITRGQSIKLTDYLLYPRLDSAFWEKDFDALNAKYSKIANRCQTCTYTEADTLRGRFCINTSMGHVQMDTSLHNFSLEKLIGQWNVVIFGVFEITDSILPDSKVYYRKEEILKEQNQDNGSMLFTNDHIKTEFKNISEIPNKNKRYKILEGRFLTTKSISGYCGATIVGLTNDEFLILDDHTYRTLAKKENYLVVKTSIRRIILKKSTTAQHTYSQ